MSRSAEIRCDICKHQFKTYSVIEQHYEDYSLEDVTCYYPLPEENAHLVRNYICDNCYTRLGDIVKQLFVEKGENFSDELDDMKKEIYEKYQKEIDELEEKNKKIISITNKVKAANGLLDLDEETINDLKYSFPHTLNATYYLNSAIEIEKRLKEGKKKIYEWADDLGIEIEETSTDQYRLYDLVNKDEFKEILMDCKIKDKTFKEMSEIIAKL